MIARSPSGLDRARRSCLVGRDHECSPGLVNFVCRLLPAARLLREPRAREMSVLARLCLVEHDVVASRDLRLRPRVTIRESNLGEKEARLQLTPRIVQALIDVEGRLSVDLGPLVVVGVEGNHREESLARRFTTRILQFPEARAGSESALMGSDEIECSMVGVAQGYVALGKT